MELLLTVLLVDVARDSRACGRPLADLGEFTQWVRTLGSYKWWKEEAELELIVRLKADLLP